MKDFQIVVSEHVLRLAKEELIILGAVCAVIIFATALLVCKELKQSRKGEEK